MKSMEISRDHLAGLVQRYVNGHEAALDEILRRVGSALAEAARRLMGRLRMNRALYDVDEAVSDAVLRLSQAARSGTLRRVDSDEGVRSLLLTFLKQSILDARRRLAARRRGGGRTGGASTFQQIEFDLEFLNALSPPPDVLVIAREQVEWRLRILAAHDAAQAEIVVLRMEQFTNNEIASHLGLPLGVIERKFRIVRSILGPAISEAEPA